MITQADKIREQFEMFTRESLPDYIKDNLGADCGIKIQWTTGRNTGLVRWVITRGECEIGYTKWIDLTQHHGNERWEMCGAEIERAVASV